MTKTSSALPHLEYPHHEKEMKQRLDTLLAQWKAEIAEREDTLSFTHEHFVNDGFYPYYTNQSKKILFIGREGLWLEGASYIECLYTGYKEKDIAGTHINRSSFHRKMLKIAYGLIHDNCRWEEIPKASTIAETFGEENGISFGFMNLSKISNDREKGKMGRYNNANWQQIEEFLHITETFEKKYFQEEIRLLDPDIIIVMNFSNKFHYLGEAKQIMTEGAAAQLWSLTIEEKKYPLIDAYHFSATLSDQEAYYDPILHCLEEKKTRF